MIRWERSVSVKELIVAFSGTTITDIRIMNQIILYVLLIEEKKGKKDM